MSKNDDESIWPDDKRFAVCLTHDVDRVIKTYQYFTHFLKTKDPYHLKSFFIKKQEPYWNFGKIMDIEKKYDVKSTFFFLNESKSLELFHPRKWPLSLGRYNFYDEKVAEIIQKLHANGWEIGLHGSYESYRNKDLLKKEKKELGDVLGDEVIGIRQHYLNLEIPKTWKIQHETGFEYDASFGYNDKIGFRDEKYLPFYPLNNSFLVIPLTIMDTTLFSHYRNESEILKKCINIMNEVEKRNGLLTISWHQRAFNEKEFPGWSRVYEEIIIECKNRDCWIATCDEIVKRWGENEK